MNSSPIPNTGDPRVDAALGRIREKFTDLEDAMIVQAHLEKRLGDNVEQLRSVLVIQNDALKGHGDLLVSHEDMLRGHGDLLVSHEDMLRAHVAAHKSHDAARVEHEEWMKHMQDKLDALTDIVMRREGGSEARQS
jgi:hypothetical protein